MRRFARISLAPLGFCLVFSVFSVSVWAGVTGKIAGVTRDKETKKPIPAATVQLVGTAVGAFSNPDGEYFLINIPVGTYKIKATSVGYAPVEVDNVHVTADQTTTLDLELEPQAVQMQEIRVTAERPLIQRDQTGTSRVVTSQEFANLPVRDFKDAAALQTGVVKGLISPPYLDRSRGDDISSGLYVRGGRSNEIGTYVDGFTQQNPLTGLSTVTINPNAIEEIQVLTGGFSAEYGRIMSGVVNTVTRSGTAKYHGSFGAVTDNLAGRWIDTKSFDNNVYEASFGGPFKPNDDRYTFYFSGEQRWNRDQSPGRVSSVAQQTIDDIKRTQGFSEGDIRSEQGRLPANHLKGWSAQGKLSFKLTPNMNLQAGALLTQDDFRQYRQEFLFDLDHTPRVINTNRSVFVKLNHNLNRKTYYNAAVNWFFTDRFRGDGLYGDNLKEYGRTYGNPNFNINGPLGTIFWPGDDPSTPIVRNAEGIITKDTLGRNTDESSLFDDFLKQRSWYIGGAFNVASQVTEHHLVQGGADFQRHTLRRYHHLYPANVGLDNKATRYVDADYFGYDSAFTKEVNGGDNGAKHPLLFSVYLQDKMETEQAIVNLGLRYDYLSSQTKLLADPSRPFLGAPSVYTCQGCLVANKARHRVSPRLGVAFPIAERTQFHINYGKFFQLPNLEDLYVGLPYLNYKVPLAGYYFAFGNPNLLPEHTTAYEVGVTQGLTENSRVDVTAYFKDVSGLVEVANIESNPSNFASFRNNDFGTIKGVDISYKTRRTRALSLEVNYSYSQATGTGSTSQTQRNIAWTATEPPKLTHPLDFDQRHKISMIADLRAEKGQGPKVGNYHILENAGINVLLNAGSGLPYTPAKPFDAVTLAAVSLQPSGPINSSYRPWTFRIDLKATKKFSYAGADLEFYVTILNLTDRKNALTVYPTSGSPTSTGFLSTETGAATYDTPAKQALYHLAEQNPSSFDVPRMVRFGTRLSF